MTYRVFGIIKLLAFVLLCSAAASALRPETVRAGEMCFHECNGLDCELDFNITLACDEESLPGANICTNFKCVFY